MSTIYLIRHGQASFHAADYDQLSGTGQKQAAVLGQWLASIGRVPDRVIIGGMKRHMQTAMGCLQAIPDSPDEQDWLIDSNFNEYDHREMLTRYQATADQDAQQDFRGFFSAAFKRWLTAEHAADYAEPWALFRERCIKALHASAAATARGEITFIFSSGGVISAVAQHLFHLSDEQLLDINWRLANTGITRIDVRPERMFLHTLNEFAHIEQTKQADLLTYK